MEPGFEQHKIHFPVPDSSPGVDEIVFPLPAGLQEAILQCDIVLTGGPTGGGKTTFTRGFAAPLVTRSQMNPVILRLDWYFKVKSERPLSDGAPDPDNINSLHLDWIEEDMEQLLRGEAVDLPVYWDDLEHPDGVSVRHSGRIVQLNSDSKLIVESLFALHPDIRRHFEGRNVLKIFLSAPEELRLLRRMVREVENGEATADLVLAEWPALHRAEQEFILPFAGDADYIIENGDWGSISEAGTACLAQVSESADPGTLSLAGRLRDFLASRSSPSEEHLRWFLELHLESPLIRTAFMKHWPLIEKLRENGRDAQRITEILTGLSSMEHPSMTEQREIRDFWTFLLPALDRYPRVVESLSFRHSHENEIAAWARALPAGSVFVSCAYNQPYADEYRDGVIVRKNDLCISVGQIMDSVLRPIAASRSGCNPFWVALGEASADFDPSVVDNEGLLDVHDGDCSYKLRRVKAGAEDLRGFKTFANDVLSPLLHMTDEISGSYSHFLNWRSLDAWEQYRVVNGLLAEGVVACLKDSRLPLLQVHDFEISLVARLVRAEVPSLNSIYFGHIAWPDSHHFSRLPDAEIRREVLSGILGNDRIAFHTGHFARNFIDCVQSELGDEVRVQGNIIFWEGRDIEVFSNPLGVDSDLIVFDGYLNHETRMAVHPVLNGIRRHAHQKICMSADRTDFTKGIPERLEALRILLTEHPELVGQITFVQVLVPSRQYLDSYRQLFADIQKESARLNEDFATLESGPVIHTLPAMDHQTLMALLADADMVWISSLRDGLCLVPKEYVACRAIDGRSGRLVLSRFAGASEELSEASLIDPFNPEKTAKIVYQVLQMRDEEWRLRMDAMYRKVSGHDLSRTLLGILPSTPGKVELPQ